MKKILFILFFLIVITGIFSFLFFLGKEYFLKPSPSFQIEEPKNNEMTTVFGVEMSQYCANKLEDFLKNYGADYSKCLNEFIFDEKFCGGFDPETEGFSDVNVIVIFDASGSMATSIGSTTKIEAAKKIVSDFLNNIPQGVNSGLIVYGHKGSNSLADKEESCKGVEQIIELGRSNASVILQAMKKFQPRGWTPIATSLNFAKEILLEKENKRTKNKNYLVLLSDGLETCDGNPLEAAEGLREIFDLKFLVIGFTQDEETNKILQQIAIKGKGSFMEAKDVFQVYRAFNRQLLLIKRDCVKTTLWRLSFSYKKNNLENLECFISEYNKEAKNFEQEIVKKLIDGICVPEIGQIIQISHSQYWDKKQIIETAAKEKFNKLQQDLNSQMEAIEKQLEKELWY